MSTTGGVNLIIGFRPEMWARVADPGEVQPVAQLLQETNG